MNWVVLKTCPKWLTALHVRLIGWNSRSVGVPPEWEGDGEHPTEVTQTSYRPVTVGRRLADASQTVILHMLSYEP